MPDIALHDLLPSWVESDPLRGRAIDALGLQLTADRIADVPLPRPLRADEPRTLLCIVGVGPARIRHERR